ncbi:MAG: hypothetical protein HQL51_12970, partial [Magnetococcales bacterium]|nr:hypothetical protein [Magnetococcales bacterium]
MNFLSASSLRRQWLVTLLVAFLSWGYGLHYLSRDGVYTTFFQDYYAPAVMFACGRGFVDVDPTLVPGLDPFLQRDVYRYKEFHAKRAPSPMNHFDCANIPDGVPTSPLKDFQKLYAYLGGAVGVIWWATGVSWPALHPYFALIFALMAALGYRLLRHGMARLPALLGTAYFVISMESYLKTYRDLVRIPLILAALLLAVRLGTQPCSRGRGAALAALGGGILGVGLGFRPDVLVGLPVLAAALLFFPPAPQPPWWVRGERLLILLFCLVVTAIPPLQSIQGGGNLAHHLLAGLSTPFL